MEKITRAIAVYSCLIALILSIKLKFRFKKDVYKRLEEQRTHKQMRELRREIREKNYADSESMKLYRLILRHFLKGALYIERQLLGENALPSLLLTIRRITPLFDIAALALLIQGSVVTLRLAAVMTAIVMILYAVYNFTEKNNTKATLPKMSSREPKKVFLPWNRINPATKRDYSPKEKSIIIRAYYLRYGVVTGLPCLCLDKVFGSFVIISGISLALYGAVFHYNCKILSREFYCAMQNSSHKPMTPYHISQRQTKDYEKEGRGIGIIFLIIGVACIVASIIQLYF